jgi:hypothetical protein
MLGLVRTEYLYLDGLDGSGVGNGEPGVTGQWYWIDAICDNGATEPQVVFCDRIGDAIPRIVKLT